ncbi:MAG: hypothetical protein ACI9EW_002590 [Cellvibrionaceae bacterium]|jgi:uncharacterized protein (DUF488 family)
MFYRQKVLISLVEAFGGELANTDLQKLLFLFCKKSGSNFYDFFPYKFGAFSYTSYFDKRKLTEQGHLMEGDCFKVPKESSFLFSLKPLDQILLKNFVEANTSCRGNSLVKKTYLEFPEYAARSEIVEKTLSKSEFSVAKRSWNLDSEKLLFTIGYEGKSIDRYIQDLIFNNVQALVDVRQNAYSRKHGFTGSVFKNYLERVGIQYIHIPSLGIPSKFRKNLGTEKSYDDLFNIYESDLLPKELTSIAELKDLFKKYNRVAITCFEADHKMCHRHKITNQFEKDQNFNIPIKHI